MKSHIVQLRVEPELHKLITQATRQTGLTKSDVVRQSIRRGIPQIMRTPNGKRRRTLFETLRRLEGLEIPERYYPHKRGA